MDEVYILHLVNSGVSVHEICYEAHLLIYWLIGSEIAQMNVLQMNIQGA